MANKLLGAAFLAIAFIALLPIESLACPVCFGGDPDSPMMQSASWAVFTLLGVTGGVLSGFVGFIFHLIKRSRMALGQNQQYQGERFDG